MKLNALNVHTNAYLDKVAAERGLQVAHTGAAASGLIGLIWYGMAKAKTQEVEDRMKGLLGPLHRLVRNDFTQEQFQELVDACVRDLSELVAASSKAVH